MKLQIANTTQTKEKVRTLELVQYENEIAVLDEDGFYIVTFKVNDDGELYLVRNSSLPTDSGYALGDNNVIVMEDEG